LRPLSPMALCTLRDVTEVARLKDSLKQAEERFRYAARTTQELIWECKLENKRVWCNEGIMTVFKRQPDQAPKVLEDLIESVHPDEQESVAAGLKSLASGHTPFWLSEFRFLRGDGG
jgi:PAS domain-containing protein